MPKDPQHLHAAFEAAFNRHDIDAVLALYEPDAVYVSVDGAVSGLDAIGDVYRIIFASRPTMELGTVSVVSKGDVAVLRGKWIVHSVEADGRPSMREGRSIELVRLQPDGCWRVAIDDPLA